MAELPPPPAFTRRPLAWLRGRFRASEIWFIGLAVVVGAAAGLLSVAQSALAHGLQILLYGLPDNVRLSASAVVAPYKLVWLPIGGLAVGFVTWGAQGWRKRQLIDVVEANAL